MPTDLRSVGRFYVDFKQVGDEEVAAFLDRAREAMPAPAASVAGGGSHGNE